MGKPPRRNKTFTMAAQSKENNEARITPHMRARLNMLWSKRFRIKEENEKVKKIDPNMFCRMTDEDEHFIQMADQIINNNINGTCVEENINLYYELEEEGKEPMLFKITYINKMTGNNAFHVFNIIKINGLYYVRDRSNYIDECKELGWWFLDRQGGSKVVNLYLAKFGGTYEEVEIQFNLYTKEANKMLCKNTNLIQYRKKQKTHNKKKNKNIRRK